MMIDDDEFDAVRTAALYAAANTGLIPRARTSLFRYISMRGGAWDMLEKTLLTNTLPLSRSVTLNDPFDSNPVIVNDTIPSDISKFANDMLIIGGKPMNLDVLQVVHPNGQQMSAEQLQESTKALLQSMMRTQSQQCHIASFSRRISSELQWSHYAEGYKGLAYHFVTQPKDDSGFRFLRPVLYSSQRPIILLSEFLDHLRNVDTGRFAQGWFSFEQRSFLTKSLAWAYEEEERLVQQNVSEVQFLESELVSVILGPRFPDTDLDRLRAIIKRRARPLKIFRAKSSPTSYAIEVEWEDDLNSR
ncbi:DUF2971 domain-containing protein [Bradyrhizobium sp. F1.13.3]|uniref:DUF2971 domain-containing protein n=1 Tax=Bradyrhizobium sp. F1.13.3 TaxID=3156351 RepID=UPI0033989072